MNQRGAGNCLTAETSGYIVNGFRQLLFFLRSLSEKFKLCAAAGVLQITCGNADQPNAHTFPEQPFHQIQRNGENLFRRVHGSNMPAAPSLRATCLLKHSHFTKLFSKIII